MASERLAAALDGAKAVRYDTAGMVYAWFGGPGVSCYDAVTGEELEDYFTVGGWFSEPNTDSAEALRVIDEHRAAQVD